MRREALRTTPRGTPPVPGLVCLFGALVLTLLGAGSAHADYRNPRLTGLRPWEPDYFRNDEGLVALERPPQGRLQGSRKVREEYEVDLETGRITIRRKYGGTVLGPEYVGGIDATTRAAADLAGANKWRSIVENRSLRGLGGPDDGLVSIDIPVEFPDAIADIIGQGARLNLSGSERITFSGTSTIISGVQELEGGTSSLFPDLDMRQQLRVNLDGTIGRKIHVLVNHDSEVSTSLENKIQLRYDGDEDEVIQKIEMGNTDLSLPGAEFLSFRKSQQGLFGAKAVARVGALDLSVIASKQEGETASQRFVGQAQRDSVIVRDWEYIKRTFYWVETPVVLSDLSLADSLGALPLRDFELFIDDRDPRNDIEDGAVLGFAYVDPSTGMPADSVGVSRGFFHRLRDPDDYQIDLDNGVVTLRTPVGRDQILGAWFIRDEGTERGSITSPDTLSLRLLAPPEQELYQESKGFTSLQILEQKNVYRIGAQNIDPDSFEMRIIRTEGGSLEEQDTQNGIRYTEVVGLDYKGFAATDTVPDGKVEPEYVDFESGTVVFPNITPFAPDSSVFATPAGSLAVNVVVAPSQVSTGRSATVPPLERGGPLLERYNPVLYDVWPDDPSFRQEQYLIEMKFSTPTPTFSLNRFNILDGSETVRLNGRTLTRGVDYDIDYEFGQLTFRTAEASRADANIEVDFEFVPLFGQAKESLVGASGTWNFTPDTRLSSTWLFFSRSTPEERPRLGQEPSRILVGNMYGQWITNPGYMTGIVNLIPLVRSDEQSEFQLQGEVAMSIPNPNTKDQIYIDDMEGVEDSREFTITRGVWSRSSEPSGPTPDLDKLSGQVRPLPFAWYNPENTVRRGEVFLEQAEEREGQDFIQVMELGAKRASSADSTGWMGVMRNLSNVGEDFSEKKFLEIWVNDFGARQGKMVFDMGEISEDSYVQLPDLPNRGRGQLDTEDVDFDGELTSSTEDTGLDNQFGVDGTNVPGDDGDDDFDFSRGDPDSIKYERINGWEKNSRLDTEDLDGDRLLDDDNAYFSYVIDLANTQVGTAGGPAIYNDTSQPGNHWRLYRLLLDDGQQEGPSPNRRAVKYVRLWFDGMDGAPGPKVQVASVKVVGATWRERQQAFVNDGTPVPAGQEEGEFAVNVVNNKESDIYCEPFDPGEQDGEPRREQSLTLNYRDLPSGARRGRGGPDEGWISPDEPRELSAYREILDLGQGVSQNFTQYEELSFYLRDGAFDANGSLRPGFPGASEGTFFFRFGPDTLNFYEFSTKEIPGEGASCAWRELELNLNDLAELKLDPPNGTRTVEGQEVEYRYKVVGPDTLAVYGLPTLSRVRRMTLGVRGDNPSRATATGQLWVNEIRLRRVRKEVGYAGRLNASARFADFATFDGNVRQVDSEFRRIEGGRNEINQRSWIARGDVKMNKFFDGRGFSLPIIAEVSGTESVPRLAPNSDIVLEEQEDKDRNKSTTDRHSLSSRFAKTRPSRFWPLRYTIDNLTFNFKNDITKSRTPFERRDTELTTGGATYNLNPGQGKTLRFLSRFDISYMPTLRATLIGSLNSQEAAGISDGEDGELVETPRTPIRTRILEGTAGIQWDPVRSNTFDSQFNFNKKQDFDLFKNLSLKESIRRGSRELSRDHSTRLSWRPSLLAWFRPVLSYDTSYNEDGSPAVQPADLQNIPLEDGGPIRVFRVSNSATREASFTLNLRQLVRKQDEPTRRASAQRGTARRTRPPDQSGAGEEDGSGRGETPAPGSGTGDTGDPDAEGDGEGEGEDADDGGPGLGLGTLTRGVVNFMHMFGDIRYTYTDRRSSRYGRVGARPSLGYQFGFFVLDRDLIVTQTSGATNLVENNTDLTYSQKFDTSFQPTSDIYLDGGWTRSLGQRASAGRPNQSEDITWPDLSMNVEGLERTRLLKRWARSSNINSSYRKTVRRSGDLPRAGDADAGDATWYDSENTSAEFSPLFGWTVNWNSGLNTTLSHNRSRAVNDTEAVNGTVTSNETGTKGFRFTARYSFSAPQGISILGKRLRFRSDLTLNVDIDRSESKSETKTTQLSGFSSSVLGSHRKSFSIKPRATYNFSRSIQGSLDLSYGRNTDLKSGRKETVVRVALEALINF